jgi:hypothetical protein
MENSELKILSSVIEQEITWLAKIISRRLQYFRQSPQPDLIFVPDIKHENKDTYYTNFITKHSLSNEEHLLLALSFIPQVKPNFLLDQFRTYSMDSSIDRDFSLEYPEIGLVNGYDFAGFVPTGLTFLFLMAGRNIEQRLNYSNLLRPDSFLFKEKVIHLERAKPSDPIHCGRLILSNSYFDLFTGNSKKEKTKYS